MIYLDLRTASDQMESAEIEFRVVNNFNLTSLIKELVLEPVEEGFTYKPGQFVQLRIPPNRIQFRDLEISNAFTKYWHDNYLFDCFAENTLEVKRNYSMVTNPAIDSLLRFNIRIGLPPEGKNVSAGCGSSYLFNLKQGDNLSLLGPFGDFLIKDSDREMVYIGGGVGMAPLRSHISYLLETLNTPRKVSYWYGARTREDLFYEDYFKNLQEVHSNFSFQVAFSDIVLEDNQRAHIGFISDIVYREYLQNHPNPREIEYYLCGPPAMISASLKMLEKLNVPNERIAFDEF